MVEAIQQSLSFRIEHLIEDICFSFLKSFCEKSFGSEAASYMEQFYTLLYSRIDLSDAAKEDYTMPGAQKQSSSVFAPNVALLHQRYPDEVLAKLDALLKNGEENI